MKDCGVPLTHRVRLILGADEESGFGCVKHYFAHEEMPVTGFTPDAMFPLVYAEKGIANAVLTRPAPPEGRADAHRSVWPAGSGPTWFPTRRKRFWRSHDALGSHRRASERRRRHSDGRTGRRQTVCVSSPKAFRRTAARPKTGVNAVAVLCDALLMLDHQEDQVTVIQQIHDWAEDTTGASAGHCRAG